MPQSTGLGLFDPVNDAIGAAFGEDIVLTREGEAPVTVTGVFDGRHFEVELPDGEVGISDYQVTVACRRDDAGAVQKGDQVTARNATWRVTDTRPDSEGWVALALSLVTDGNL